MYNSSTNFLEEFKMYLPLLDGEATSGGNSAVLLIGYVVIIGALFYFMLIRPQKKKQKEEKKLRDSLQIGDEILTIGGFYGKIISIKEETVVIESQLDHSKQKIARWAIQQNLTIHDDDATVKEK